MTEYQPPYGQDGTYLNIVTHDQSYRFPPPKFYLLDDDSGEIATKFFGRLGNPKYKLGPETYHDGGYNTYTVNHGFTIPNSKKFRFREPKTARFNELACPIDNQRRVHGYFLCYGEEAVVHEHRLIGGAVNIRQGGYLFSFPWDYGVLSVENVTRVEFADKNLIGERGNTWDDSQAESRNEDYILLQDLRYSDLFPSRFATSIYILEVSDRTINPGSPAPVEPTDGSETLNTRYNTLVEQESLSHSITPLRTDGDVAEDLRDGLFLTVHPAAASSMSSGEKTDMFHLANGYFGKGIFFTKPGLGMLPHPTAGDYNINIVRKHIQYFNSPQEYGVYIQNQDIFLRVTQGETFDITTTGFTWVENLLSKSEIEIHSSQYTHGIDPPSVTQNITVKTLIGEHHWWDKTKSSNKGGVSDNPFFRVKPTSSRDGVPERHLEKGYPALIADAKAGKEPITAQIEFDSGRWKRNLRDFCIRSDRFPETLYFRFDNYALNPDSMVTLGGEAPLGGGSDSIRQLISYWPGYNPGTNPPSQPPTRPDPPGDPPDDPQGDPPDVSDRVKYSMLEVDIVPMNTDIFPTSLPIMWSNRAFQFMYNKTSGDERIAINRLQNSVLDFGYEVMVVGSDYYDNANTAITHYPATVSNEEYSRIYRENPLTPKYLISTYSEWEFPGHLTGLPTGSGRDAITAFGIREPAGHRIIVANTD